MSRIFYWMLGSVREIVKIKKIEILGAKAKSPRKTFSLWTTSNRLLPKLASRSENHHIIIKNAFFRICTETWPQSLQLFFSFFCVTKINLTIAIKRLLKNFLQNIQKSGFRQYLVNEGFERKIFFCCIFSYYCRNHDSMSNLFCFLYNFKFGTFFN